jgi:hypothetical protein
MYVNFKKIKIVDINGQQQEADFSQQLGNQLYMTGHDIEACELGKRIYFAKGEMELSEKDIQTITQAVAGWSYVARTAIIETLKEK